MIGDSFGQDWQREARTGFYLRRFGAGEAAYDVAVALPEGAVLEGGFPLLMVMDAALHFDAVAGAARALARRTAKTGVAPMVVVGIASGADWGHDAARRERDLLPEGAGQAALQALVRERVLADVAVLVPVNPARRAIMGHSFGGVFALEAAAQGAFGACVSISPSIWRVPELPARLAGALAKTDARVLIAFGSREPHVASDLPAVADAIGAERVVLAGEDHGSVVFAALPAALRFVHGGSAAR